ncbi:MAG TPA: hypothetical protein PK156_46295, partial [Polyangium sp.]|nr:hypothetical protein [Polyangium sp.]
SWNYEVKKRIKKFKPRPADAEDGTWRMQQQDVDRVQDPKESIAAEALRGAVMTRPDLIPVEVKTQLRWLLPNL